jgi:hypothetical protein
MLLMVSLELTNLKASTRWAKALHEMRHRAVPSRA